MGTIFKDLEDGYVQKATVFNICMYMMNNTLVRNYTKSEPRTLGDILDFIDTYKAEIEDSFRYSEAYNFQDDDERIIAINTFMQMFSVFKKAVSNTELKNVIFKDSSWNMKYENEEFANYCTNGAVFESATEVYVVFEGTIDAEWLDNGEGLSQEKSDQQENALAYFNMVAQENGWTETDTVIVSGHSKGGNKAQYITLYAEDADIIDYCISVNGQGFSNLEENIFYETRSEETRNELINKMYSVCGEYDYVHGLGNVIIPIERTAFIDLDDAKYSEDAMGVGHCMQWFFYRDGDFQGELNPIGVESDFTRLVAEVSLRAMELDDAELEHVALGAMQLLEITNGRQTDGFDGEVASRENMEKAVAYALPILLDALFETEAGQKIVNEFIETNKWSIVKWTGVAVLLVGLVALSVENDTGIEKMNKLAGASLTLTAATVISLHIVDKTFLDNFSGNENIYEMIGDLAVDILSNYQIEVTEDAIFGTINDDILRMQEEECINAYGRQGSDVIYGSEHDDYIDGGSGNDFLFGGHGNDELCGGKGNDYLHGESGEDILNGGSGDDRLYGNEGDDVIEGGSGSDYLYGNQGNDSLVGGVGNDVLAGGEGNDIYTILLHHDNDVIINKQKYDAKETDIIDLSESLAEDIRLVRAGADLIIYNVSNKQKTMVSNVFSEMAEIVEEEGYVYSLPNIQLKYDIVWKAEDIKKKVLVVGTKENDELFGIDSINNYYSEDETFIAGAGNDRIYGGKGDDNFYGGEGNDRMYGGSGANTYYINSTSGNDIIYIDYSKQGRKNSNGIEIRDSIVFEEDINKDDLIIYKKPSGFIIKNEKTGQKTQVIITMQETECPTIEFADGTTWETEEIKEKMVPYRYGSYLGKGTIQNWNSGISEGFCAELLKKKNDEYKRAKTISIPVDPLVIDLQGNGFELTSKEQGVHFDLDANGMAEKAGWVAPQDALLVLDRDGDGIISGGQELFGDSTVLSDGSVAKSGFQALQDKDSNGDGIIDNQDEVFGQLKIWQDMNQDGISDAGEMLSLEACGIEKISLETDTVGVVDSKTNATLRQQAAIYFSDGRVNQIGEFIFDADYYNTKEVGVGEGEYSISSFGNMKSLSVALEKDSTGELYKLVEEFKNGTIQNKGAICRDIIYYICGANNVASGSRGAHMDAKQLQVVETIMGEQFVGMDGTFPNARAAEVLIAIYNDFEETYYNLLNESLCFEDYMDNLYFSEEQGKKVIHTEQLTDLLTWEMDGGKECDTIISEMGRYFYYLRSQCGVEGYLDFKYQLSCYDERYSEVVDSSMPGLVKGTEQDDVFSLGSSADVVNAGAGNDTIATGSGNDIINAGLGNDTVTAGEGNDVLYGGTGDDVLYGEYENDTLFGGSGDDVLYGENGNDTLVGGTGNDHMTGDAGADTFVFNLGDGTDTVYDYEKAMGKVDRIVFGEGISAEDVTMERNSNNLVVKYSANDSFTILEAYRENNGTGRYFVEQVEFADGTVWDTEEIANRANIQVGTEGDDVQGSYGEAVGYHQGETFHMLGGNDTVYAGEGNDTIHGDEGDDSLHGENGNDTLIGGAGNDTLTGGNGEDVYIIGAGDGDDVINNYDRTASRGNDKIVYGEGVLVDDISITRFGNDLLISNAKTQQTTVISGAYSSEYNQLYNLEFYDEDTAVIDYSTTSLNVTYAVKEEIAEKETEEVTENEVFVAEPVEDAPAEDFAVEAIPETETAEVVTETAEVVTETQEAVSDVADDSAFIVTDEDIAKMTDLMVQEMAGADSDGIPQIVNPDANVVAESDSLLWVE